MKVRGGGKSKNKHPADFTVPRYDCQKQPPKVSYKKAFLKNFAIPTGNTCAAVYFLKSWRPLDLQLYEKETLTQVFFCKYCRVFNTTYFEKHLKTAAF